MKTIVIDVPELGNRSYIVHDGKNAIIIDPSRRTQEIIDRAKGLDIKAVFETHIHNDYVTGGYQLSAKLAIPYYVSAADPVSFARVSIEDKQKVVIGELNITAIASPGHTLSHLSYLVEQTGETDRLFTGGSVLYGTVGRPDLISKQATPDLAKAQYQTAHHFVEILEPETIIYPTHGFGSFCAATPTEAVDDSTLSKQLLTNNVFTSANLDEFVTELLANLDVYPSYYVHMAPANLKGPNQPSLNTPSELTKQTIMLAMHQGSAVIDLRTRALYASEHLMGTYNIELSNDLTTYAGWLIGWDVPIIIIGLRVEDVQSAQGKLSLIGRDVIGGYSTTEPILDDPTTNSSYPIKTFADLSQIEDRSTVTIVDVRRNAEWNIDHIDGAIHIPLHTLESNISKVPDDKPVWVHCMSGFRASIAASILDSTKKQVVLINDNYSNTIKAGITIKKEKI